MNSRRNAEEPLEGGMALDELTEQEREIALRCLRLVATSQIVDDEELQTVTGFDRQELQEIERILAAASEVDEVALRAIGQCLNSVTGYPHGKDALIEKELGTRMKEIDQLAAKWFAKSAK